MKKIFIFFIILSCFSRAFAQAPAIAWQRAFGGSAAEVGNMITQTSDGGYVMASYSSSANGDLSGNHGFSDYWVVKMSPTDSIEWQSSLGGGGVDQLYSIQQTTDGGYILAGGSNSHNGDITYGHGSFDCWVVKLTQTGGILWRRSLGGSASDVAYCARQTPDGGYIVVGNTSSTDGDVTSNHGASDAWVVKLNSVGAITWQKTYGGSGLDVATAVQPTPDGGYIFAGKTTSTNGDVSGNHGGNDLWVVKLGNSGALQWQRCLGGSGEEQANAIQALYSGSFIVAGSTTSANGDVTSNHGGADEWVINLGPTGNIIWQKTLGGSGDDQALSIQSTYDGGYVVAGSTASTDGQVTGNHGSTDEWVVKLNDTGAIQWQQCYGGPGADQANSVQQIFDGGYIVAGTTASTSGQVTGNHGSTDAWVVKLKCSLSAGDIYGPAAICRGASATFTDTTSGGHWTASGGMGTIDTNGVLHSTAAGKDGINYSVTDQCGTAIAYYTLQIDSVIIPGTVTGNTEVCIGNTFYLGSDSTGPTWSATNVHASILFGNVTGVTAGKDTIDYTLGNACGRAPVRALVSVVGYPVPGTISGPANFCQGAIVTFTNGDTTGTWGSQNGKVSFGGGGVATAVNGGNDSITYSIINACGTAYATKGVYIQPLPQPDTISGGKTVCIGSTLNLTDASPGGTWSSSNSTLANVGSGGIVTGAGPGTVIISYTLTNICGPGWSIDTVTVKLPPTLSSSLAPPGVCSGAEFNYIPSSLTAGATFIWSRSTVPGLANPASNGIGNPAEFLQSTSPLPVLVTYNYAVGVPGCIDTQQVTVVVKPMPTLTGSLTGTTCNGLGYDYTAVSLTPGTTLVWNRSSVAGVLPTIANGTNNIHDTLTNHNDSVTHVTYVYTLSANGCSNTQHLVLAVYPLSVASTIVTHPGAYLCPGTMYQNFGAAGTFAGVDYSWSASGGAAIWATGAGGQYCLANFYSGPSSWVYLTASLPGGICESRDSMLVTVSGDAPQIVPVTYSNGDLVCQRADMTSYQWGYDDAATLDSTLLSGETNQNCYQPNADFATKYYWVMTTFGDCQQKSYMNTPLAINDLNNHTIGQIELSPNPSSGSVKVILPGHVHGPMLISITDIAGRKVKSLESANGETLNLDLANGLYLLTATWQGGKATGKLVVTH